MSSHPHCASPREQFLRLASVKLGRDLALQVYPEIDMAALGTPADSKPLKLPDVTLIAVDTNLQRLEHPLLQCTKDIEFGCVRIIDNEPIHSMKQYSRWVIKEIYKHVQTSHLLIFQWDGYVKNWKAWNNSWLEYDYIGATWGHKDGMNVGNGGFSLRTRRLMEIVATDFTITESHPEDVKICRHYRKYLETEYGIKFAPEEVARQFSIEGYGQGNRTYTTEFGFHGKRVKFTPPAP